MDSNDTGAILTFIGSNGLALLVIAIFLFVLVIGYVLVSNLLNYLEERKSNQPLRATMQPIQPQQTPAINQPVLQPGQAEVLKPIENTKKIVRYNVITPSKDCMYYVDKLGNLWETKAGRRK